MAGRRLGRRYFFKLSFRLGWRCRLRGGDVMLAYGVVYDEAGPVAFVKDGCIYRGNAQGELVGYEEDGRVLDLNRDYVGQLGSLDANAGTPVIRRLLEPNA
jgi:hypothetical protein